MTINNIARRNIMTRAHDIRRADGVTMADALRKAWSEAQGKLYSMDMNAYEAAVRAAIADVKANIRDIHDVHKVDILTAALRAVRVDGMAELFGQQAGLVKWAHRNYAA